MKARGRLLLLLGALAAFLALPACAAAKPGYKVHPGGVDLEVWIGEKRGHSFTAAADDRQHVRLLVEKELFATTSYSTKGRVSSKRIKADFGPIGRIDVKIDLAASRSERDRDKEGDRRCKGRDPLSLFGTYRGVIKYSGEGNAPAISARRGALVFTRRFRQVCKRRPSGGKQGNEKRRAKIEIGGLQARAQEEGRTTVFEAFSLAPPGKPSQSLGIALGAAYERRERVRIARTVIEIFSPGIVMSKRGSDPETLDVKLEKPFVGKALYSRSPGSPADWTGNLSARLPGVDPVPFTGPGFNTVFCRGLSFTKVERCLYGSGSHSQPLALARLSSLR